MPRLYPSRTCPRKVDSCPWSDNELQPLRTGDEWGSWKCFWWKNGLLTIFFIDSTPGRLMSKVGRGLYATNKTKRKWGVSIWIECDYFPSFGCHRFGLLMEINGTRQGVFKSSLLSCSFMKSDNRASVDPVQSAFNYLINLIFVLNKHLLTAWFYEFVRLWQKKSGFLELLFSSRPTLCNLKLRCLTFVPSKTRLYSKSFQISIR